MISTIREIVTISRIIATNINYQLSQIIIMNTEMLALQQIIVIIIEIIARSHKAVAIETVAISR